MGQSRSKRPRILLIAEAANPEWVSVPLVGWSHARALAEVADVHVVTQTRNRQAIEGTGWREGNEFTAIDTEAVARPVWKLETKVRSVTGLGWTTTTAFEALSYYLFEELVWRRFQGEIRAGAFDIVHRLTPLSPTIPSSIAKRCKQAGVPFVWGPINGGVAWPKEFRDVLRKEGEWLAYLRDVHHWLPGYASSRSDASALVIGSKATWEQFAAYQDKCVYVPENAVAPERFQRFEPRGGDASDSAQGNAPGKAHGNGASAGGPLRAVFVGRLVPYKGADMLLQAAAPLIRSGQLVLDILGDGPQREELRELVQALGIEAGVTLAGWVEHEALHARMRQAHVLAFPSVREFGGAVVLEAMTLGLVPIVVDYAGPSELVTDETGFRVPLGERGEVILGMRAVLARLAQDRSPLRAMAQRGQERVDQWFTWDAKARQLEQVYQWVLGRGPKPFFGMPLGTQPSAPETTTVANQMTGFG